MSQSDVTFVVMAGGRGERLWPLVRAVMPKVCLSPNGAASLVRATVDRLHRLEPRAHWLIVTTQGQDEAVRAALPARLRRYVLVEPEIKNTAACVALAALRVAAARPRSVLVVVPADHWVGDVRAFQHALRQAIHAARQRPTLATIGVRPTAARTGLGYLCGGARAGGRAAGPSRRLVRFIEKPSPAQARRLVRRPATFWNVGVFVGRAEVFVSVITRWLPAHHRRLSAAAALTGGALQRRLRSAYRGLTAVSFDQGVMRHVRDGVMIEGRFPWEDLGSWDVWARLGKAGQRTLFIDSHDVSVVGEPGHLVAAIGVRNLLVVQTPSATLLCRPERAQSVRQLVQELARRPQLQAYL